MEKMMALLDVQVFGNSIYRYLFALVLYLVFLLGLRVLEHIVVKKLKTFTNGNTHKRSAYFVALFEQTALPALYFAAFYFAIIQLNLGSGLAKALRAAWVIVMAFQITRAGIALLMYGLDEVWMKKRMKSDKTPAFKSLLNILRMVIWGIGIVFVLDNLGFNVAAVVAGLGIGGIAVALAAQTILGDLFNYFVIFFDRPFEEGDFIVFDDYMGVIENIGIKSTRLRSLGGEQIVISNSNLTGSRIRNYKRMAERRIVFKLGIIYETPLEKIKKVPAMIRTIIESHGALVRFDRAHFKEYGAYSLDFEVVYYVLNPDYNKYMDIQQNVNLTLFETFQKEEIQFAYPTSVQFHKALDPVDAHHPHESP